MTRSGAVALALLLISGLPARAATALRDYPWLRVGPQLGALDGLDLAALAPSAARLATLAGENVGYVEELIRCTAHVSADGTLRERVTMVRRFLTSQGVEQAGDTGLVVLPSFETVSIEQAMVINEGGVTTLDPTTVQVVPRQEPRIFSDAREVIVPLPALRPGSTAVFAIDREAKVPDFLRPWSRRFQLRGAAPVERFEVELTWDAGMATPAWASNDPDVRCAAEGERRLVCRGASPALQFDADLSEFFDHTPQLIISEGPGWNVLVDNVMAVVEREAQRGDVHALATRLTAGATTPRARLDAIYRFVADDVRYVALEHGHGAIVPRPPQTTLDNRFGDCKDKVVLFLALARAAGLEAHAVLTSTYYHDVDSLLAPSSGYFNHVIACVRGIDDGEVCVDPTLPKVAAGDLGKVLQGAVALDLLPGTNAPRQLPTTRFAVEISVDGTVSVACDGSLTESLSRRFTGTGALSLRAVLDGRSPGEQQHWLEDEFARAIGRDLRPRFTISGVDAPLDGIIVNSEVTFPPSRPLRETLEFQGSDVWLITYAMGMQSANRHYPYRHSGLRYSSTVRFEFCQDVRARFPGAELDLRAPFGSLERQYERSPHRVAVHTTFEVPAGTLPADQVPRFNRFLERVLKQSAIWIGFDRSG